MGPERTLVLIDTNIFVIDLRYKRDAHYKANRRFLEAIAASGGGVTTVLNLLELCGILSFNLSEKQLLELWHYFFDRYRVAVFPDRGLDGTFPRVRLRDIFEFIRRKTPLGDALMLAIAKGQLPVVSTMVTWDKEHMERCFWGKVLTPEEYQS